MARTLSEDRTALAHLDDLGQALTRRGHLTMIVTAGMPRLEVLHRAEPDRYGSVLCQGGDWFWWAWADRIAPVTDLEHAADLIDQALRSTTA